MSEGSSAGDEAQPTEAKARVLVIDDNPTNVDLLSRRLRRKKYEVDTALSGKDALAAIAKSTYDAVLLDIMMPEMSGIEVLRRIRTEHAKHELPVIMATAKTDSRDVVEALKLGANDYVTKPLDFPIVLARLESQIAVRREFMAVQPETVVVSGTDDLGPGTVLDRRYEILAPLGEGGFAVVYRAKQLSTGQSVALKILRSQRVAASDEGGANELARFEQEMKVIAKVKHPAIVRLIDSGAVRLDTSALGDDTSSRADAEVTEYGMGGAANRGGSTEEGREQPLADEDLLARTVVSEAAEAETAGAKVRRRSVPYYVMELLEGETLADLIERQGGLEVDYSLELLMPVLCGVHTMHTHGIVHRDLKPSNIFLARDPSGGLHSKVLDFGIAKLRGEGSPDLTTDVGFIGTPAYMSPEQAIGARDLGPACDQYTLATVLYESITGRRPYEASGYMHLLTLVSNADYVPIDEVHTVNPGLRDALHRALARDPADRYEDLMTFGLALLEASTAELKARWEQTLRNHCAPPDEFEEAERTGVYRVKEPTAPPRRLLDPAELSDYGRAEDAPPDADDADEETRGPGGYTLIED